MWGTDMTATVTVADGLRLRGQRDRMHRAAAKRGNRFEALEPSQGIRERFGGIGEGVARGLRLRHDHGSNTWPTIFNRRSRSSASKAPRASCGSPKATARGALHPHAEGESVVGAELRDARLALLEFKAYNEQWMLEKYDYRSPAVRRDLLGLDAAA